MLISTMYRVLTSILLCGFIGTLQGQSLQGDLIQGGLVYGRAAPGSSVLLDGSPVPLAADGRFVLGFDRDAPREQLLLIDGRETRLTIDRREYRIQRIEGIAKRIMDPSPEDLARIRADSALIQVARAKRDIRSDFDSGFVWPLLGPISGVYGSQRVYNGRPSRPHYGVDVAAPTGTQVHAPADGIVTLAHSDMFYSGGTIIVDHGLGLSSSFLHLSRVLVEVGQTVKQGDLIGEVGASGRATGPHLDWRMNWRDARIDPQRLVGEMPAEDTDEAKDAKDAKD